MVSARIINNARCILSLLRSICRGTPLKAHRITSYLYIHLGMLSHTVNGASILVPPAGASHRLRSQRHIVLAYKRISSLLLAPQPAKYSKATSYEEQCLPTSLSTSLKKIYLFYLIVARKLKEHDRLQAMAL